MTKLIDKNTMIQTYKWDNNRNNVPFKWKCQHCGTITTIITIDTTKLYECSRIGCPIKLKVVLTQI